MGDGGSCVAILFSLYCFRLAYIEPDGAGIHHLAIHTPEIELDKLPVTLSPISTPSYIEIDFLYCSVFTPATPLHFFSSFFFERISVFHFTISLKCGKTCWCTLGLDWGKEKQQLLDVQMCLCFKHRNIFSCHSLPIRNYLLQPIVFKRPLNMLDKKNIH